MRNRRVLSHKIVIDYKLINMLILINYKGKMVTSTLNKSDRQHPKCGQNKYHQ